MPKNHKHAAIMFTDIVGYTALMGSDEDKAFEILSKNREIHQTFVEKYHGRIIKEIGDGILISFNLASDAVYCAIGIQKKCTEQDIPLKIGIHEGEMVFEGADVLGDAVNIASRLEADSHEGCIYISESVYRDIKNRSDIQTKFLKEKRFKNVDEPIKVYKILCEGDSKESTILSSTNRKKKITILSVSFIVLIAVLYFLINHWMDISTIETDNSKIESTIQSEDDNSIAVMPFKDLSPEQDQEYLGDGIAETIINSLIKVKDLKVPGRTSSFSFKGKDTDIKTIGEMLGVNKILEGSVQKSGNKLRVTAQLINTADGYQIWSEQYDREFTDIFSIQDAISAAVISKVNLDINALQNTSNNYFEDVNSEAYEFYLKGRYFHEEKFMVNFSKEDFKTSEQMFLRAIEIDPNFGFVHTGLAHLYQTYISNIVNGLNDDMKKNYQKLMNEQIQLGYKLTPKSDYTLLVTAYCILSQEERDIVDVDSAFNNYIKAIQLNPRNTSNIKGLSEFLSFLGLYNEAKVQLLNAKNLNPLDKSTLFYLTQTYYFLGNYESAQKICDEIFLLDQFNDLGFLLQFNISCLTNKIQDAIFNFEKFKEFYKGSHQAPYFKVIESTYYALKGEKEKALADSTTVSFLAFYYLNMSEEFIQKVIKEYKVDKYRSSYIRLINLPFYDDIKNDSRIKDLVSQEKAKYEMLKAKYGNLDFLDM